MMARVRSMAEARARRLWHRLPLRIRERLAFVSYAVHGAPPLRQYAREEMNRDIAEWFAELDPATLDAVEVSGNARSALGWKSYTSLHYPDFDLVKSEPPGQYDVVICEQVLEHVPDPDAAVRNLRGLARPDGRILVSTPFLIRIHGAPNDYWRFTPLGLRTLLERQGLQVEILRAWGNRSAVITNLRRWSFYRPWRSLRNNRTLPVVVWAVARPGP
jgi:SAM-dependent methyltransferase